MYDSGAGGYVDLEPVEGGGLTNNWQEVDDLTLDYSTQGEFCRYYRKLNYRGAAKFRFVREEQTEGYPSGG